MRNVTDFICPTGATTNMDMYVPINEYYQLVQIQRTETLPMYVRILYYYDLSDDFPLVLFADWLRATCDLFNIPAIVLNFKNYEQKGFIRISITNESGTDMNPKAILHYGPEKTDLQTHYDPELHYGIWAYDDLVERHTNAGVISYTITPQAGSWFDLDYIQLTGGFTGAEDVTAEIRDQGLATILTIIEDNTQTGVLYGPKLATHDEDAATTPATLGKMADKIRISYPDHLHITVSAVPATDDILVRIRARLKDLIPDIEYGANTQAQAAYVNDYSIVI